MSKIIVFIPAYRCANQIIRVLAQFNQSVQAEIDTVMVVDNLSPDDTLDVAIESGKRILTQCNFIAWQNQDNYGLGGSHKAALGYAIEHDFDYLIVLHGDDQADIRDIIPHVQAGKHKSIDCMLGARFMKGSRLQGYSTFRTFGNVVYNQLFSLAVCRFIYDLGSGLNLYSIKALKTFYFKQFPDDLTFNYVMLLGSYHRKQRVDFFPISWREEDQRSNVKMVQQSLRVLKFLLNYFFFRGKFLHKDMRAIAFERYTGAIKYSQAASE